MAKTRKAMSPREAREKGLTGDHRPSNRRTRGKTRRNSSKETPDQRMLREGGWRPVVIGPNLILFEDPWGGKLWPLEDAIRIESSRPEPTGEMLEPVSKNSPIPHDPETGIPWVWGTPPPPKRESNRARKQRLNPPTAKEGVNSKTGARTPMNRKWRRRKLQRQ